MTLRTSARKITASRQAYNHLRDLLGADASRAMLAEFGQRVVNRLTRGGELAGKAPLLEMIQAMPLTASLDEVLAWLQINDADQYRKEFTEVSAGLDRRYASLDLTNPLIWAVEGGTSELLYCLVRARQPERVVETGIANGHSSYVILSAMLRNGCGRLASVDISRDDVGQLVTDEQRERWDQLLLTALPPTAADLQELVGEYAPFDVFFHDGDHRFPGQLLDYQVAVQNLAPDGLLLSDDIDATTAWLTAARLDLLPDRRLAFVDNRKAIGLAK